MSSSARGREGTAALGLGKEVPLQPPRYLGPHPPTHREWGRGGRSRSPDLGCLGARARQAGRSQRRNAHQACKSPLHFAPADFCRGWGRCFPLFFSLLYSDSLRDHPPPLLALIFLSGTGSVTSFLSLSLHLPSCPHPVSPSLRMCPCVCLSLPLCVPLRVCFSLGVSPFRSLPLCASPRPRPSVRPSVSRARPLGLCPCQFPREPCPHLCPSSLLCTSVSSLENWADTPHPPPSPRGRHRPRARLRRVPAGGRAEGDRSWAGRAALGARVREAPLLAPPPPGPAPPRKPYKNPGPSNQPQPGSSAPTFGGHPQSIGRSRRHGSHRHLRGKPPPTSPRGPHA